MNELADRVTSPELLLHRLERRGYRRSRRSNSTARGCLLERLALPPRDAAARVTCLGHYWWAGAIDAEPLVAVLRDIGIRVVDEVVLPRWS